MVTIKANSIPNIAKVRTRPMCVNPRMTKAIMQIIKMVNFDIFKWIRALIKVTNFL